MTRMLPLVLLCHCLLTFVVCRKSSVSVKGSLHCGGYPAGQILIRLWRSDQDHSSSTEMLGQTHSDVEGTFKVVAQSETNTDWTPLINIYHDCNDVKNVGRRKLKFLLPKSYVEEGETPKRTFDLGVFNLETYIKEDEERVETITKKKRSHSLKKRREVPATRETSHFRNETTLDQFANPDDRIDPW